MMVDGLQLPASFDELCEEIRKGEQPVEWVLREKVDAYGHAWDNFDLIIMTDAGERTWHAVAMQESFADGGFEQLDEACSELGFVENVTDLSRFVQFGRSVTGDPYCFDFGDGGKEPSVVAWTDGSSCSYWRQVAPDFTSFMALFMDRADEEPYIPSDEEWGYVRKGWELGDLLRAPYAQLTEEQKNTVAGIFAKGVAAATSEEKKQYDGLLQDPRLSEEDRYKFTDILRRIEAGLPSWADGQPSTTCELE